MTALIVQIMFIAIGLNFMAIVYLVFRSQNGGLRSEFMAFFIALAWSAIMRAVEPELPDILHGQTFSLIVGIPILATGTHLVMYLFKTFKAKKL